LPLTLILRNLKITYCGNEPKLVGFKNEDVTSN
jgi:hypothetical protein